jgi:GTPase SAR1 family protein
VEEDMFDFTLRQARLKTEYKVTILGHSRVGKSAMVTRLMEHETFLVEHQQTLIDYASQQMFMLDKDG